MEWEQQVAELWASIDDRSEQEFLSRMEELVTARPPESAEAAFEHASALDSMGHSADAIPLYRRALKGGLEGVRRRRAVIQLASSLRSIGQAAESVAMLTAEKDAASDELDDAVKAFLALGLVELGREREAVSLALSALGAPSPPIPTLTRQLCQRDSQPPQRRQLRRRCGKAKTAPGTVVA